MNEEIPRLIPYALGLQLISEVVKPLPVSMVAIETTLGHVLAEGCEAKIRNPRFDNSQVDGYAVGQFETDQKTFSLVGDAYAGQRFQGKLESGQAIRIRTGSPIPDGTKAVIMQEDTTIDNEILNLNQVPTAGSFIRHSGQDFQENELILKKGTKITPRHIGLGIAAGIRKVPCYRMPKIKLIATGDEIRNINEPLGDAEIYDSTTPMLRSLLNSWGLECEVIHIKDSLEDLVFEVNSSSSFDFVAIVGGASVGDRDYAEEALKTCNYSPIFRKVKMRPGMPTSFFSKANNYALSVPGNPVAAYFAFSLFGRQIINCLIGMESLELNFEHAINTKTASKPVGFTQFLRCKILTESPLRIQPLDGQGSHLIKGLADADGLILFPELETQLFEGQSVDFLRF